MGHLQQCIFFGPLLLAVATLNSFSLLQSPFRLLSCDWDCAVHSLRMVMMFISTDCQSVFCCWVARLDGLTGSTGMSGMTGSMRCKLLCLSVQQDCAVGSSYGSRATKTEVCTSMSLLEDDLAICSDSK